MRTQLLAAIQDLDLGSLRASSDLPWDAAGTALYIKNPKVFYVGPEQREEAALINTLDGNPAGSLATRTTTIQAFVTVDAKQQPADFDDLVEAVRDLKDIATITAVRSRECDISQTFEADRLITEFTFRFVELKIS